MVPEVQIQKTTRSLSRLPAQAAAVPALRRALHLRHKVAAALAAVDIPLRLQLLIGVLHRDGAHLQVLGQGPL